MTVAFMKFPIKAGSLLRHSVACAALSGVCALAVASPLLRCTIEQGGKILLHEAIPVQDPYAVASIDINGRFRFKAVVVGDAGSVEYVKVYAYDSPKRQPVLIQYAKYLQPKVQQGPDATGLTGVQVVYSPRLGRDMQYQCTLQEVIP